MPLIVDYNSLGKAITDYSHRADIATFQDYLIQSAQEAIQRDIFAMNFGNGIQPQEATLVPTPMTNGVVPVPAGYLSPKDFQVLDGAGNAFTLLFKDIEWIYARYPMRAPEGLPAYISRDGTNFVFGPYPDSLYSLQGTFYQTAAQLTVSNPTNWMVLGQPHLVS